MTHALSKWRRQFLIGASSAAIGLAVEPTTVRAGEGRVWDLIIVGGGTAGLPAAIFAARRGLRVLIVEASLQIGGTLFLSTGQMSAAGTKLQKAQGIKDTPQMHFDDVMRISHKTADPTLVKLAVTNAAETFDWLTDSGLRVLPEHPVLGLAHEPYSARRYAWGAEGGMSILEVIEPLALAEVKTGRVTIQRGRRVRELIVRKGAVVGVRAENDGGKFVEHYGRAIVLASGGYASNPKLFYELSGYKQYGRASYPYSQGDGYLMALAVGGYVRGRENYICGSPRILADADEPSEPYTRFNTYAERRQPWEIYVNARGQRFVAEDNPSIDDREHAFLKQPDMRSWVIFDQAIFDSAPIGIDGWNKPQLAEQFVRHPMFKSAPTLPELAAKIGLPADALSATVARYNTAQAAGTDPDFQRKHMPVPILKPPFYSIRQQSFSITSTVGVGVDEKLRVTRKDGRVIEGLYAAGEILGSGQLMGSSAAGGMMVTPALTFGRLLGQSLGAART